MSANLRLRILLPLCALLTASACELIRPSGGTPPGEDRQQKRSERRPTRPPKAEAGRPTLALSRAHGRPGAAVRVSATLDTGGASVAGTQNDIVYDPAQIAVAATSRGKPDCRANTGLGKEGTAFSFLPPGCRAGRGGSCTSVRALVLSLSNVDPIPNGSALYTCNMQIAANASAGVQKLSNTRVGFSSPTGQSIAGSGGDGSITVETK
jgi:hypothetical protein